MGGIKRAGVTRSGVRRIKAVSKAVFLEAKRIYSMDACGVPIVKPVTGETEGGVDDPGRAGLPTGGYRLREAFKAPAYPVILDPRGSAMPKFTVNGEAREVNVPGSNPLL